MDFPNAPLHFHRKFTARTLEASNKAAVDLLGGEALEGSGFEEETPEPEFQFDWTQLKDESEGGLQ